MEAENTDSEPSDSKAVALTSQIAIWRIASQGGGVAAPVKEKSASCKRVLAGGEEEHLAYRFK